MRTIDIAIKDDRDGRSLTQRNVARRGPLAVSVVLQRWFVKGLVERKK